MKGSSEISISRATSTMTSTHSAKIVTHLPFEFINYTNENSLSLKNDLIKSLLSPKKQIQTLNTGRSVTIANTTRACQIQ